MIPSVFAVDAFSTRRQFLWDLCYRATGIAADADRLLRDCFARAADRPPVDDEAWGPHLTRAAGLLSMDTLRYRKRRDYVGCWLPSPVETASGASLSPRPLTSSHGPRYDASESGSMAFLIALEALEARERLTFLMCDAFGVELHDVASTLELAPAVAKAALQQGRRKMQDYDSTHVAPTADVQGHTADVLRHCLSCLQNQYAGPLEKMLTPDARLCFDGAGEFVSPVALVTGPARIARLLLKFAVGTEPVHFAFRMLNSLPAALGMSEGRPRWAPHFVFRIETQGDLVCEVQAIMATGKLTAVKFGPP